MSFKDLRGYHEPGENAQIEGKSSELDESRSINSSLSSSSGLQVTLPHPYDCYLYEHHPFINCTVISTKLSNFIMNKIPVWDSWNKKLYQRITDSDFTYYKTNLLKGIDCYERCFIACKLRSGDIIVLYEKQKKSYKYSSQWNINCSDKTLKELGIGNRMRVLGNEMESLGRIVLQLGNN